MNEIFSELVDKKKNNAESLIKQIAQSSKSIIDNKLILETIRDENNLQKEKYKFELLHQKAKDLQFMFKKIDEYEKTLNELLATLNTYT